MSRTRRHAVIAVLLPLVLTACGGQPPREVSMATVVTSPAPPIGASVSEIRRIEAQRRRPDPEPRFVRLGPKRRMTGIGRAVLVDLGTGCQYVARTMHQDTLVISALMEDAPDSPTGSRQLCGTPHPGTDEIVVLAGGDIAMIEVAVERDRDTGCEYVVGTVYQDDVSVVPRVAARGEQRRQICRRAGRGA